MTTKETIDRKFHLLAINPITGKVYTEKNAVLLCAKDAAVPAALRAYRDECIRLETNEEHVTSICLLIERIERFQQNVQRRTPDTVGAEISRCIDGIGV
jgi:hypothetical protein